MQRVALREGNSALAIELAVSKLTIVPPSVSPLEYTLAVDHIAMEISTQFPQLSFQTAKTFLLAIVKFPTVAHVLLLIDQLSIAVHQASSKLTSVDFIPSSVGG